MIIHRNTINIKEKTNNFQTHDSFHPMIPNFKKFHFFLYTFKENGILRIYTWSVGEVVNTLGSHPSIQGFEPPTDYQ